MYVLEDTHTYPLVSCMQCMESEFVKWMDWYGKSYGDFELIKGDFLEPSFDEILNSATWVVYTLLLHLFSLVCSHFLQAMSIIIILLCRYTIFHLTLYNRPHSLTFSTLFLLSFPLSLSLPLSCCRVVFTNNFAFGPKLNHEMKLKFSNLKDGTKIVSSHEFCPLNFKLTSRNLSGKIYFFSLELFS